MGEKRIQTRDSAANLLALPDHHINRIVQKHVADLSRGFGHENGRGWKTSHQHGQCADVILVGMRDQDRLDVLACDRFEIGQRIITGVFGMHSTIEHQSMVAYLEII